MENVFAKLMEENKYKLFYKIYRFEGSHPVNFFQEEVLPEQKGCTQTSAAGAEWKIEWKSEVIRQGVINLKFIFTLNRGSCSQANVGIGFKFTDWHKENYVLMPAAAYNGNRFESRQIAYPPILKDKYDMGVDAPTIITDIPRLAIDEGPSLIQQLTRDLSTPAIGFYTPLRSKGCWILTNQNTALGDTGIDIEESIDRNEAEIRFSVPGVRFDNRYTICNTKFPCEDKGANFSEGDSVEIILRIYFFECPKLQTLFDYFADIRKDLSGSSQLVHILPFFSGWEIQEKKYNEQNWEEKLGYYSVGMRESIHQDWQIGWVGGIMATYPLLFEGSEISRQRALKNYDFVFGKGQDKSGLFFGCGHEGEWFGDNFYKLSEKWHLIRKSSDALYFIIKQFMLLEKQMPEKEISSKWADGIRKCADAFVRLWRKYGQFGQFVDSETGEIIVGGSVSAGIAPAGLALAWKYFGDDAYIEVARQSAIYFYEKYVKKGYTTGGPGEICQCPDSESAFGLLESFVVLYEVTGEEDWLCMAKDQANQCISWCVSYDFKFPDNSTFDQLNMHTTGSVYANVQNKHSAPGICTLSGDSLFKLYRYTGEIKYLQLIREIAHNMTQYLSREDRPIKAFDGRIMPAGWMNERVEMSDWYEPVGEIFYGSCWCEVSNMLTYTEVPGLYVQPDTGFLCTIDHIEAEIMERTECVLKLKVTNPTKFRAKVKIFSENHRDMSKILGQNALWGCETIDLKAGEEKEVLFPCNCNINRSYW